MKSFEKHIRFENIKLQVESQHPKDISRVHFQLIESNNQFHRTKKYGNVNPTSISWHSPIEFIYQAQQSLKFETICEHQYGYQISQLKALYYGDMQIKPQDFFVVNHFNVFDKSGKKCGEVSFMIKIVDREIGAKYNEEDVVENKQIIRPDLVSRVSLIQASLSIYPKHIKDYEGKKAIPSSAHLKAKIDSFQFIAHQKEKMKWTFKHSNKIQLFQKSQDRFSFQIKDGDSIIFSGFLLVDTLLNNKRFLIQSIPLQNQKGIKIGTLNIETRIIEKKEILDLMYSPKKLQNAKIQKTQFETESTRLKEPIESKINYSEAVLPHYKKRISLDLRKKELAASTDFSIIQTPENISTSRVSKKYDLYFGNRYREIRFTQSKRFQPIKSNSPYISYIGHQDRSDFSPSKKHKGANFSKTQRIDFTKPYKNHPGIGNYHLPSIWQKS